jgi:hypothetical protein
MTTPRIYTYKVTFEEIPHWYWGVHKEKKFGEFYIGSPKTHKWMWEFYTPKIQILEFFPYTDEGWKEANLVEKRLIKPDLNNLLCLNENCGGCISLACASEGGKIGGNKIHEAKTKEGKSLHALKPHEDKNAEGKSLFALEMSKKLHEDKNEGGKSLHTLKLHEEKNEEGKSLHAVNMGKRGAGKVHEKKDENGKSLHALRLLEKLHATKDENGKCLNSVRGGKIAGKKTHEKKDENGKSLHAMKTLTQVWESTIDGFRSTSSAVARHNRARGWDPAARIRIS